jgi:chaperone BCS1
MTTNHIEKIDPAIYRPGRMNLRIELKAADHYQIAEIYKNFYHRDINKEILLQIPEYKYTPAEFIFHFANYIMMADSIKDAELLARFI